MHTTSTQLAQSCLIAQTPISHLGEDIIISYILPPGKNGYFIQQASNKNNLQQQYFQDHNQTIAYSQPLYCLWSTRAAKKLSQQRLQYDLFYIFIFFYRFFRSLQFKSSRISYPKQKILLKKKKKNFASEKKTPPLNYKLSPFFPLTIYYNDCISKRNSHENKIQTSYQNFDGPITQNRCYIIDIVLSRGFMIRIQFQHFNLNGISFNFF